MDTDYKPIMLLLQHRGEEGRFEQEQLNEHMNL